MCKLIVAIKLNNEKNDDIKSLIMAQIDDLKAQKDGIGSLCVTNDNEVVVERLMGIDNYDSVVQNALKDLDTKKVIAIHTRMGTSGVTGMENVHFFEKKGHFFAHNGFVSEYAPKYNWSKRQRNMGFEHASRQDNFDSYGSVEVDIDDIATFITDANGFNPKMSCVDCASAIDIEEFCKKHNSFADLLKKKKVDIVKDKNTGVMAKFLPSKEVIKEPVEEKANSACDSLQFLQNLPKKVDTDSLYQHVEATSLSGVATLITPELKLWMMATRDIEVHTDYKNYLIMYSFSPSTEPIQQYVDFLGLPILHDEVEIVTEEKKIPEGVYSVDLKNIKLFGK